MNFKDIDIISLLPRIWEWLINIDNWDTPEGWLARCVVWLVIIVLIFKLFKYVLNEFIEIRDKWKQAGLPVVRFSSEEIIKLRRRKQFCNVLRSDLATIAKAESWNDQYFTELEAEIEAEGYYYMSNFDRFIRRKTSGLRREPSLIKSIDNSAEQFLLLSGEPGSGKSVALRHLANQLAERAIRSNDLKEKIPLYINLKELTPPPNTEPTSDSIEQFVLENIRRGDADTVDYVREHWDEYCEKGIWFFLFDSFDEIPAVMHAPSGSTVVKTYSEAIRKFLTSMSSCRAVVASREFKGPETLTCPKFRILSLSPKRQEKLIDNSFLKSDEKYIVLQHLATPSSNIHHSPMFLTLLCRYVKDEHKPPINDYSLLSRHIERLAHRDSDYISKKYNLLPEDLLAGALRLAVLFAERPNLSLAPTHNEIIDTLREEGQVIDNLEDLLAALVDIKIGRCDVQEYRPGDRRFTFAHRRYQETLFVTYLIQCPEHIPARELLTNSRWREYCATLIQTQPIEALSSFFQEAEQLLGEYAQQQQPVAILNELGEHLNYYEWDNDQIVPLLQLLQESLARHIADVPGSLSEKVQEVLQPRWDNGDEYDRKMVIDVGGLLPQNILETYLTYAIRNGAKFLSDSVFQKATFLKGLSKELSRWTKRRLGDEIFICLHKRELLRLKALVFRLPTQIDSERLFHRLSILRNLNFLFRFYRFLPKFLVGLHHRPIVGSFVIYFLSLISWEIFALLLLSPFMLSVDSLDKLSAGWQIPVWIIVSTVMITSLGMVGGFISGTISLFTFIFWKTFFLKQRFEDKNELQLYVGTAIDRHSFLIRIGITVLVVSAVFFYLPIFWEIFYFRFYPKLASSYKPDIRVLLCVYFGVFIVFLPKISFQFRKYRLLKKYKNDILFIFQAKTVTELISWLSSKKTRRAIIKHKKSARSLIRLFSSFKAEQFNHPQNLMHTPLLNSKHKGSLTGRANMVINHLIKRLEEL